MASESPLSPSPQNREWTPSTSARRPGRRSHSTWILGAAVLVVLAFSAVKPVQQRISRWRASTIVKQADELVRQQLFADAIARYKSAISLDNQQTEALRGLAHVYSAHEKSAALPVWKALLQLKDHNEKDIVDYIQFTLSIQRFDLAEIELSRLLERTNTPTAIRLVAADFFERQGDPARALAFAEEVLRSEPDNPSHRLRVARSMLAVPLPDRQKEGFRRLSELAPLSPADRLAIFRTLETTPSLPAAETRAFLDALPPLSPTSAADLIAQADVRLRLNPDPTARNLIIGPLTASLRTGSPEGKLLLCRWLLNLREPTRLLQAFSLNDVTALPILLPPYLEALGLAQRWEDLIRATDTQLPIDPWISEAFRAAAGFRLNRDGLAQEHWRRAVERTQNDPIRILAIGDIAHRMGVRERAIEAFNRVVDTDLHRTAAYRRLARVYNEIRDTDRLRRLMLQWSLSAPDEPSPNATYAYLCALVHQDLDDARARILQLTEAFPSRAAYRATLAFIELRRNQPQAALQLIQRTRNDGVSSPQTVLVRALVLDANGQSSAAKELVRSLRTDNLLPEERDLLNKVMAR